MRHTIYSHTVHVITTAHRIVFAKMTSSPTRRLEDGVRFVFSLSFVSLLSLFCPPSRRRHPTTAYTFPIEFNSYTQRANNQTENGRALGARTESKLAGF